MLRAATILVLILAVPGCKQEGSRPSLAGASTGTADGAAAVVTAKNGKVQVLRAADGSVAEAKVGDRLSVRDALRTEMGEADVAVDGVRVRLHEGSRLELKQVGQKNLRARVRGTVESEVGQKGNLDVEIENSDALAHSQGGHFFVTADGRGVVAVASVTGTVNVSGGGRSIDLRKGEVTRISKRGRVEPGSRVFVQGEPVEVQEGGTFRAEVPLRKGKQKIAVVTVDTLGRRKEVESVVLRDDSLPDIKVKKRLWQWR